MKSKSARNTLLVVAVLTVCGGFVWAQQGGRRDRPQGGPQARPDAAMRRPGGAVDRGAGLGWLLGEQRADIETVKLDAGMKLVITTQAPDLVKGLRAGVRTRLERLD